MNQLTRFILAVVMVASGALFTVSKGQVVPGGGGLPQSDITFQTTAIDYPGDTEVEVPMLGTVKFATGVKGKALVKRKDGFTQITVDIGRLPRPSQVGPLAATYVIWAITPEGLTDNLGEFRKRSSDTLDGWLGSKATVSTRHRTFALILTAEPHYLVNAPSRLVAVANQLPVTLGVNSMDATISFSGDADLENKIVLPSPTALRKDPKYPIELVQAAQAVEIARYYEAEAYARRLFSEAETLLSKAEAQYQAGGVSEAIDLADQSIRLAERTRKIAISKKKAALLRQQLNERDSVIVQQEEQLKDIALLKAELEKERKLRTEALAQANDFQEKYNTELANHNQTKSNLETATANNRLMQQQIEAAQIKQREQEFDLLRERVSREFETRVDSRGTVVVLPSTFFVSVPTLSLSGEAGHKLDVLIDYLNRSKQFVSIESLCVSSRQDDPQFATATERARILVTYLTSRGVTTDRIQAFARGTLTAPPPPKKGQKKPELPFRVELVFSAELPGQASGN